MNPPSQPERFPYLLRKIGLELDGLISSREALRVQCPTRFGLELLYLPDLLTIRILAGDDRTPPHTGLQFDDRGVNEMGMRVALVIVDCPMNEVSRPYEVVQVSTGRLEIPRLVEVRLLDLRWTGCNDVLDGHHRIFGRAGLRHRGKILLQRRQPAALNLVEVGSAGVGVLGHGRAVIVRDGLLNMAHGLELFVPDDDEV